MSPIMSGIFRPRLIVSPASVFICVATACVPDAGLCAGALDCDVRLVAVKELLQVPHQASYTSARHYLQHARWNVEH